MSVLRNKLIQSVHTMSLTSSVGSKKDDSGSEYSGCPLECPFENSASPSLLKLPDDDVFSEQKKYFKGLSAIRAREVIQKCLAQSNKLDKISFWVLCDGEDTLKTSALGIHKEKLKLSRVTVSQTGPLLAKELPSLSEIKKIHCKGSAEDNIKIKAICRYSAVGNSDECEASPDMASQLMVECTWSKVNNILEKPAQNAQCCFIAKIVPGDIRCASYGEYVELDLLQI